MRINGIKETCLYIKDIERTYDFYHDKLGFSVVSKVEGRHVFFRVGEDMLLCFLPESTKKEKVLPPHFAYGIQHIAFWTSNDDYEELKEQMQSSEIKITHEEYWESSKCSSFYFQDPDGHVLEIVTPELWN